MSVSDTVDVDGTKIAFSVEGTGDLNLVLVHGFAAHSHWWDWVVPSLLSAFRIVRIDLSGHGESGYREQYSIEGWAAEVAAVQRAVFGGAPATLVAHSLGGRVVIAAAQRQDCNPKSVLIFDTAFPEKQTSIHHGAPNPVRRTYETREAAIGRFRLLPAQPLNEEVLRALAGNSIRKDADGWTWKHDYSLSPANLVFPSVSELAVPFDIAYGDRSAVVDSAMATRTAQLAGPAASITAIPGGHHHVLLDSPNTVAEIIMAKASQHSA